jgi:two-component system, sensor histidine kinase and response regulator
MEQGKPSVLLVDDIDANLVALEALLADLGCELVRARSGNEALRQLLKREFAVVLLDVQMPEMDGFEVARYARENPHTREVPIIFLTAMHGGEESVLRGYGSGAVDFLTKPINAHILRSKVRVFLDLFLSREKLAQEVAAHKRTLAALELANGALRHFTQAASHDLGAPLRSVRSFLEALSHEVGDSLDVQARDYLDRSRRASQRMDALLGSLRAYARLARPPAHVDVDCRAVVELVEADLSDAIAAASAKLAVAELPSVRGDRDRIYQLFLNLIGNAIKYRKPSEAPCVRVSAERRDERWLFCVEDNGIGVDARYTSAVFEVFSRLQQDGKVDGSGLGLAICQQIVEQHGGKIWLESELGRGSRFYFSLPALPAAPAP